ncbi:ABC transporter ATP-binding protein [Salinisphaera sp. Q1T1-3]|uniref:ABC transporter ATP-binding protein n=1 Tax=Salinisphaera sp. Q1T1-3 TaxID=2321229 RepID=UPI000E72C3D9|nr:ABC transporter ATP-binding protein [Salinisphaera sp. Q1T1-3]RJS92651.1 ABC transporter ATP-binding protein [Salinisphaera sp. Q1T1-3]
MFRLIRELYSLLTPAQRRGLKWLQALVVLMSFAEIAGVALIGPFMSIATDKEHLQSHAKIWAVYKELGFTSPNQFLVVAGLAVFSILVVAAVFSVFASWRLFIYGSRVGAEISQRLYNHYLYQSWLFHASGSSSNLTKQVSQETNRLTDNILIPLMQLNAKMAVVLGMALAVFFYSPGVAVSGLALFILAYALIYFTVRRRLIANGAMISETGGARFKLMAEGFGGIKDVLVLGRQEIFTERFEKASNDFAYAKGVTQALGQTPRYLIETVAYGSIVLLVIYLITLYDGSAAAILPALSFYALVGFKMLPALQSSYQNVSKIRSNLAAFEAIKTDLNESAEGADLSPEQNATARKMPVAESVALDQVRFTYPGKQSPALDGVSIRIPKNHAVGLVGATGSGKSTAIDVFLGLLEPEAGHLRVDGTAVAPNTMRAWQNSVGYVPQDIFLADATIRENIAFGIPPDQISEDKIKHAASLAHLDELLDQLSAGLETRVGERGVQLSGGQKQRIGIARALYDDAEVLIFDEATSALDGVTERKIMEAIYEFAGKKTVLMIAHRLSTVRRCNNIYLMKSGAVMAAGTYEELSENSDTFRQMAHDSA